MGTFDHLEWTYDGAFEQLFGLGRGEFEQKFSKNSNARGVARGGCLSFDLTDTLSPVKCHFLLLITIKAYMTQIFLLAQIDEERHFFYCESTLGCRVIQI